MDAEPLEEGMRVRYTLRSAHLSWKLYVWSLPSGKARGIARTPAGLAPLTGGPAVKDGSNRIANDPTEHDGHLAASTVALERSRETADECQAAGCSSGGGGRTAKFVTDAEQVGGKPSLRSRFASWT